MGFFNNIIILTRDLLINPWTTRETLLLIVPLVLILVLIHLYFGRNRSEELGWNSAFSNSVSLLWVCVILFTYLLETYGWKAMTDGARNYFAIIIILTIWVVLLIISNFFHIVPKKLAFLVSSADSIYVMAYLVISFIMGGIEINFVTLLIAIFLFGIINVILQAIKHIIPMTESSKQVMKKRKKKKIRKEAAKKAAKTRKENKR